MLSTSVLTISDLTYRIAGRTLLEGTSAQINAGWKVGLVGRNGTGKSTLLALIRGELQPDGGDIRLQKDVRVGFVAQEVPGGAETPAEVVLAADAERLALLAAAEEEHHAAADHHERLLAIDAHRAESIRRDGGAATSVARDGGGASCHFEIDGG